jgi:signal transduction histidine kinase/DNA-binding response OmpR family regulator
VSAPLLTIPIEREHDVVTVRQRAREVAATLGFDAQDQTRVATAISELARNAFMYARGGEVEFRVEGQRPPQLLAIRVSDRGPGIADVDSILAGRYRSGTGMGLGLAGARRLVDRFEISSTPGQGTAVTVAKLFPRRARFFDAAALRELGQRLQEAGPQSAIEEIQQQNRELFAALEQLRQRQEELSRLNAELEDTNRGVVALYAELDEKADTLRRADELKSRFLSNMSHEFRTPLNSMLALSALLLDDRESPLTVEQRRQVGYIRQAAQDLAELVDDLLDLARVEAGKVVVRPAEFDLRKLFAALRGMLRPLLVNESVSLVFDEPDGIPPLYTDEAKLSQILRNFLSNALKFTERGEIRVSARLAPDGDALVCSVADTGIGIAPEDQGRIFDEFTQVDNPVQKRVRGTGLGLPLVRKLAMLLGGSVSVNSTLGVGSTFSVIVPLVYPGTAGAVAEPVQSEPSVDSARPVVLVVEDSSPDQLLYAHYFRQSPFQIALARTLREARQWLARVAPSAVVLDIRLGGDDAWAFIAEIREDNATRHLPIVVVTSIDDQSKGLALGADAYAIKPVNRAWLLDTLTRLIDRRQAPRVLLIDDDEISRYLVRTRLAQARVAVAEAAGGAEGLRQARACHPHAIVLDLVMPEMSGFEVLRRLKDDPATADIPVVVLTSKRLSQDEQRLLAPHAARILSKDTLAGSESGESLLSALSAAGVPGARDDG